jgi:cytochrome c peroxidase
MRRRTAVAATTLAAATYATAADVAIRDRPAIEAHVDQAQIDAGKIRLPELMGLGKRLFETHFNKLDGQGRPATTGHGIPRGANQPAFIRTSGPDANSCQECHFQPRSGGAGGFASNVFVLAQELDPVLTSLDDRRANDRNSLGMMGAGPIEMLAREMTAELIAIREAALAEANATGSRIRRPLKAKGISFGTLIAEPDGRIDPQSIDGVDWDLVVKPFHQKGAVVSLRDFTNTAMNHHHGMQSSERFGAAVDADKDGVADELTAGDITAVTIYQAALDTPKRVLPKERNRRVAVDRGERLFEQVQCSACHVPSLVLDNPVFSEPGPYNPPGNLRAQEVKHTFTFDLTRDGVSPRLERLRGGKALVRAFTDLKRHDISDSDYPHFANEKVPQGMLTGVAPASAFTEPPQSRPVRQFLTRKLWDVGSSGPYGHRGDLTTMTEAIHHHGGEARISRDAFFALPAGDQVAVVEFLNTLQVLPEGD